MGHLYAGHLTFIQNYIWIPLFFAVSTGLFRPDVCTSPWWPGSFKDSDPGRLSADFLLHRFGFLLVCAFCGAYPVSEGRKVGPLRLGGGWLLFVLLGFSLSAVQVFPTHEFSALSPRGGGVGYEMATYESLHPQEILAFLLPDIFGNPVDGTYWRSRDFWHFWESCGYVGILPLGLAFVRTGEPSLRRLRIFFLLLICVALVLALGKYNPLYPWIYVCPDSAVSAFPRRSSFCMSLALRPFRASDSINSKKAPGRESGIHPFHGPRGRHPGGCPSSVSCRSLPFLFQPVPRFSEGPVTHANLSALYGRVGHSVHAAALLFFAAWPS